MPFSFISQIVAIQQELVRGEKARKKEKDEATIGF